MTKLTFGHHQFSTHHPGNEQRQAREENRRMPLAARLRDLLPIKYQNLRRTAIERNLRAAAAAAANQAAGQPGGAMPHLPAIPHIATQIDLPATCGEIAQQPANQPHAASPDFAVEIARLGTNAAQTLTSMKHVVPTSKATGSQQTQSNAYAQPGTSHSTASKLAAKSTYAQAGTAQMAVVAERFANSRNRSEALDAGREAVRIYTTNSNPLNLALRADNRSAPVLGMQAAINYWLQHAPDFGTPRTVSRIVNMTEDTLRQIFEDRHFTDRAFMSTTSAPVDPNVSRPFRNTIMHITASFAANVAAVSPDPHMREHVLLSPSTLRLLNHEISDNPDYEPDYPETAKIKVQLWLEQLPPPPDAPVPDPWSRPKDG